MSKTYAHSTIEKYKSRCRTVDKLSDEFKKYGLDVLTGGISDKKVYLTDLNHNYGVPFFTIRAVKKLLKALQNNKIEGKEILIKLFRRRVKFIK